MSEDPFGRSSKDSEAYIGADAAKAVLSRTAELGTERSECLHSADHASCCMIFEAQSRFTIAHKGIDLS